MTPAQRRRAASTLEPTRPAIPAQKASSTKAMSFWKTGTPRYPDLGSTNWITVEVALGDGSGPDVGAPAESEPSGVDGVEVTAGPGTGCPVRVDEVALPDGCWAGLLVTTRTGVERVGTTLAVEPGAGVLTADDAGGGRCEAPVGVRPGVLGAGCEVLGAGFDVLGAGLEVLGAGREVLGVVVFGGLVGTVGVGRDVLDEPGPPVLAQLSRRLPELTTAPSTPITRTWYMAGRGTASLSVTTEALGSSKLTRVPTGSSPASTPSERTSSTV